MFSKYSSSSLFTLDHDILFLCWVLNNVYSVPYFVIPVIVITNEYIKTLNVVQTFLPTCHLIYPILCLSDIVYIIIVENCQMSNVPVNSIKIDITLDSLICNFNSSASYNMIEFCSIFFFCLDFYLMCSYFLLYLLPIKRFTFSHVLLCGLLACFFFPKKNKFPST